MSASIFSFARARQKTANRRTSADWGTQELAELYRVRDRLVEAGLHISLHRGITDEGEPWAVFERDDTYEPMVHIARINEEVVVVNNATGQSYHGVDFRAVTEQMLQDAPLALPRQRSDSKVVIHPRAVFTAFVAAAIVVTELARNVESAKAAENAAGHTDDDAATHLLSRLFGRENGSQSQGLAGGFTAFGALGAAALAIDLMASELGGSDAAGSNLALDVATVPEAGDVPDVERSAAAERGQSGSDPSLAQAQGTGVVLSNGETFGNLAAMEDMQARNESVLARKIEQPEAVDDPTGHHILEKQTLDLALDFNGAQSEAPEQLEAAPAKQSAGSSSRSETAEAGATHSSGSGTATASASSTSSSSTAKEPDDTKTASSSSPSSGQAKQPTATETADADNDGSESVDGDADDDDGLVVASLDLSDLLGSRRDQIEIGDSEPVVSVEKPETSDVGDTPDGIGDKDGEEGSAIAFVSHFTTENGDGSKLKDDQTDYVIHDGGDASYWGFRFDQDKLMVSDAPGSMKVMTAEWIDEISIVDKDVHLVGVDGHSIWLYEAVIAA
ncbi:hypothetical protein [Pararhizobium haloflavum]|uniref:hypothetical protein n=1 Tax=Pararhizobium haloflavum TaxID=2037914 RepID=UPI000C1A4A8B|nr:hypothetical protein [Pararhizobium haloflavum]